MFPSDEILIARGKYSTLNREWHEQIKRVQEICRTLQSEAALILSDAQEKPPSFIPRIVMVGKCHENLQKASERLITLSLGMNELKPEAWGDTKEIT